MGASTGMYHGGPGDHEAGRAVGLTTRRLPQRPQHPEGPAPRRAGPGPVPWPLCLGPSVLIVGQPRAWGALENAWGGDGNCVVFEISQNLMAAI